MRRPCPTCGRWIHTRDVDGLPELVKHRNVETDEWCGGSGYIMLPKGGEAHGSPPVGHGAHVTRASPVRCLPSRRPTPGETPLLVAQEA